MGLAHLPVLRSELSKSQAKLSPSSVLPKQSHPSRRIADPHLFISAQSRQITQVDVHSAAESRDSSREVQTLLTAHQRECESNAETLLDAEAREQAEHIRVDKAEE